jgi:chromate transporter
MSSLPAPDRPRPQSITDLFVSFTVLALQGFGGVLAVVQREFVEKKRWMTNEEFIEDWAVAQVMPGPNVINLALIIGGRYFGLMGAMAARSNMGFTGMSVSWARGARPCWACWPPAH